MIFLKYLIASVLSFSDGWFPVEKTPQPAEQIEEDSSIWVLFSKSLGDEKFLVRLPGDPVYQYSETGAFEITSSKEGEIFQLKIEKSGSEQGDLHYRSEGKWVHEHFVQTDSHFYHFKTLSDTPDTIGHEAFISSFSIERNRGFF